MGVTSQVLRFHEQLYKRTDGRVGHHMVGVPTLLLRTTGRRSGATRTNGLVYARDGDDYLVVASNGEPIVLQPGSITSEPTRMSRFRSPASAGRALQGSSIPRIPTTTAFGRS